MCVVFLCRFFRPSPISPVSNAAKLATSSERLLRLSLPKLVPKDYQPQRSPYTIVSGAALNAEANVRLKQLAKCHQVIRKKNMPLFLHLESALIIRFPNLQEKNDVRDLSDCSTACI